MTSDSSSSSAVAEDSASDSKERTWKTSHQKDRIYSPEGLAPALPAGGKNSGPQSHLLKIVVIDAYNQRETELVGSLRQNQHNSGSLISDASGIATMTDTPSESTIETSERLGDQLTLEGSTLNPYQTLTSYVRAFLASHSQSQENGEAFRTLVAPSSLKLLGLLRSSDLGYCSLRMSEDSSVTTKDEPILQSSPLWTNWGMMLNGKCLTANISESRRTGNASSLSDTEEIFLGNRYSRWVMEEK